MAEMAHLAKIPRDLRRHIGQWAQESTADVYTRDHARIITDIWQTVLNEPPPSHHEDRPADPADAYYAQDETDKKDTDSAECTPPPSKHNATTEDYPKNLGGPLTVAVNNKGTGGDNHRKVHFYRMDNRAVGHGNMTFNPAMSSIVTGPDDWQSVIKEHQVRLCKLCCRTARLPSTWDKSADTDDEDTFTDTDESDHLTDSDADTESENEALLMD